MTTDLDPAISEANLAELRRQADDVTNLCHAIPDRRSTNGMTEDVVEALNAAGDRLGMTDWISTDDEKVRVMSAWVQLLPNLNLVPANHDPNTAEWHWSSVRCFLAGAGYGAHAELAASLCHVYSQCTLLPTETEAEWMKALREAHQQSGIPACISALPWTALRDLPDISRDDAHSADLRWIQAAALLHIIKHVRVFDQEVRVMYKGHALFFTRGQDCNAMDAQPRLLAGLLPSLGMARHDARTKEFPLASIGTSRALKNLPFAALLSARPLSAMPGNILVGGFTRLAPDPNADGWFQHGMRLTRAWVAHAGRTRGFTGNDETVLGYAWHLESPDEDSLIAFDALAAAVPATYEEESPFAILCGYQPNFVLDWAEDLDAYASLIDSVLVMSVMRNRVAGSRGEFPIMWVLPEEPTPEGSTNQGKTTAVTALAGAMTPGIPVTRPADTNSAPDMRAVSSLLRNMGTVALDEWAIPRNRSHPLSASNMQSSATGGGISMGEVLENNPKLIFLRQPIVASAKCLNIPEDVRNRSIFLFQRRLTAEERSNTIAHDAMVSGEVALRMRLAALALVDRFNLWDITPAAAEEFRFKRHLALAAKLYTLRTGKNGPGVEAVVQVAQRMEARFRHHFTDADESGLMAEMESGESIAVRATTVFGTMTGSEVVKMRDISKETDRGRCTAGQLLQARAKVDDNTHTVRGMLTNLQGAMPRANDRALAQAFGRDLRRLLPNVGDKWMLPEVLGIEGWAIQRLGDGAGVMRYRLICTNPGSPHFTPISD